MGVVGLIKTSLKSSKLRETVQSNIFLFCPQVVIAVLFQLALMCLIVLDEASVLIMTCANVIRSGLVKTVPSSLVDLSTIAPVGVCSVLNSLCFVKLFL